MRSALAIIAALAAPFLLPAPLALILVAFASIVVPPVGLLAGIVTDALYRTSAVFIPYASIAGLFLSVFGYVVHRFIETRIMTA